MEYNFKTIEEKWQKRWAKEGIFEAIDPLRPALRRWLQQGEQAQGKLKPKFYALDMFPYPSGEGLHVGHPKGYIATDVIARYKMMNGFNVLHPMGWDAFGLPAENFAIKNKIHPAVAVEKNIKRFKEQIDKIGFTYDWDREINTTDPDYYKWTQWIFLQMFKKGLAYQSFEPVIWCPSCKTVLAQEDLEGDVCERCGSEVERKPMKQWVLKMTAYADRLLNDLKLLDWEESIIEQQKNWIGRSEGVQFEFPIVIATRQPVGKQSHGSGEIVASSRLNVGTPRNDAMYLEVFTTRVDTIFSCTYCVIAPEHKLLEKLKPEIKNWPGVEEYIEKSRKKSELERTELAKEKTGVELKGIKAVNPFTDEEVPLFVGDYVLGYYGTGAVMAVPAHDERDFEFAKKYNLPIIQSIAPNLKDFEKATKLLEILKELYDATNKEGVRFWLLGGLACAFYAKIIYRQFGDLDLIVKNKEDQRKIEMILEKLGFKKAAEKKLSKKLTNTIYKNEKGFEIDVGFDLKEFGLQDKDFETDEKKIRDVKSLVLSKRFIINFKEFQLKNRNADKDKVDTEYLKGKVFTEDGVLINSGEFSNLTSEEARKKMAQWLEKKGIGQKKINYKMHDWVFSRQRYWGEPIPIIHCGKCGAVAVPEKDLPVKLPQVERYEPSGTGESPLAAIESWVNVKCPKCGSPAKRETNTMPQWAGSCWYYLRYIDPKNNKALIDKEKEKYWQPVDLYVGGAEHATRHLLYARFWHKFLYDIGVVSSKEPFKKLIHVGLILAEDGQKMSKRWGNVINPDEVVEKFGADSFRMYEMFMGPFTQAVAWSTNGVIGMSRFLEKVWKMQKKVNQLAGGQNPKFKGLVHKTIKKVTEDIENFKFNTAISSLMILVNEGEKQESLKIENWELIIKLISPFAPHIAEELWERLGHSQSIFKESWPKYDSKLIKEEKIIFVIQINGKLKDRMEIKTNLSQKEAESLALAREKIKNNLTGKKIRKIIFVKDKLINIVV